MGRVRRVRVTRFSPGSMYMVLRVLRVFEMLWVSRSGLTPGEMRRSAFLMCSVTSPQMMPWMVRVRRMSGLVLSHTVVFGPHWMR